MEEAMTDHEGGPLVKVARDLREILRLYGELTEQAVSDANSRLMPGGAAMHQLGPVANLEAWGNLVDASETLGRAYTSTEDEDPDEAWSAYQTIEFWSESWRRERGDDYDMRRTIATEAGYLRQALEWAWDNELHWDEFAKDIKRARAKLEDVVSEGERSERGAPCLYDECRGAPLVRKLKPARGEDGKKVYRFTDWHCPKCKRKWDDDAYARHVTAANERTKFEDIDGEVWCTTEYAARLVGRPEVTVRVWLSRGFLSTACIVAGRRTRFVRLDDVRARHEATKDRRKVS
jgi:hypothetical protein